jgi:hypothetical protein
MPGYISLPVSIHQRQVARILGINLSLCKRILQATSVRFQIHEPLGSGAENLLNYERKAEVDVAQWRQLPLLGGGGNNWIAAIHFWTFSCSGGRKKTVKTELVTAPLSSTPVHCRHLVLLSVLQIMGPHLSFGVSSVYLLLQVDLCRILPHYAPTV